MQQLVLEYTDTIMSMKVIGDRFKELAEVAESGGDYDPALVTELRAEYEAHDSRRQMLKRHLGGKPTREEMRWAVAELARRAGEPNESSEDSRGKESQWAPRGAVAIGRPSLVLTLGLAVGVIAGGLMLAGPWSLI